MSSLHTPEAACPQPQATSSTEVSSNAEPTWTVNKILRHFGPAYLKKFGDRMSRDQRRALQAIAYCRTAAVGTIAYRCRNCLATHQFPQSCGNRHCPTCQGSKARRWLEEQQARLLPCVYFMLTFTVPKEIRPFIRSHPRECYRALFDASFAAMVKLAKDPRHFGSGNLGMTGVLHTWGRDLCYHPHLHFIVPGGALSRAGTDWISSHPEFFLPVRALSQLFRGKFRALMKRHGLLEKISRKVWRKRWIVHCQAVGDGRSALRYLAPYVFRVAIGNQRIRRVVCHEDGTGEVTYMVRRKGERRYRPLKVSAEEFVRRFLQHVLPKGLQKVRHFGFMHKRSRVKPSSLSMLVTLTLKLVYVIQVAQDAPAVSRKQSLQCPDCRGKLDFVAQHPVSSVSVPMIDTS